MIKIITIKLSIGIGGGTSGSSIGAGGAGILKRNCTIKLTILFCKKYIFIKKNEFLNPPITKTNF